MDSRSLIPPVDVMPRLILPQIQIVFPAGLVLERRWSFKDGTVAADWTLCTGAVVSVPPAASGCDWRPVGALVIEPPPSPNQCGSSGGTSGHRGPILRVVR